jgi:hypothetical protein
VTPSDTTGGTKGADTVQEDDLGAVKGVGRHVKAEVVTAQVDIDVAYQDALDNIRLKREKVDESELPPAKGGVSEQQQKDIYVSYECRETWLLTLQANFRYVYRVFTNDELTSFLV